MNKPKLDFIGKPAPPGYVAGVGRGATGFTTHAEKSLRDTDDSNKRLAPRRNDDDDDEDQYLNESNYDEFAGYGGSLFNKDSYDKDDEEADRTYEWIEQRMANRSKKKLCIEEQQNDMRSSIKEAFKDLKEDLKKMTEQDWLAIPEVGDARNRKQRVARQDKFTPLPDSLLAHQAQLASGGEKLLYIDPKDADPDADEDDPMEGTSTSTLTTAVDNRGDQLNIDQMNDIRGSYMSLKLRGIAQSKSLGQESSVNVRDYLTNLESKPTTQITDMATLETNRKIAKSLRKNNPKCADFWIYSARLEEAAGKLSVARKLIREACTVHQPNSPNLWLEAIRLSPEHAKGLIVEALRQNNRSLKLWLKAAELEDVDEKKRKIYSKALRFLPKSMQIWEKSVELEKKLNGNVKTMLKDAIACCPECVEFWIALAELEPDYEEAVKVLVRADEKNPTDRRIWIKAAKLHEMAVRNGAKTDDPQVNMIDLIIGKSLTQLRERNVDICVDEWLREAINADLESYPSTCYSIMKQIMQMDGHKATELKYWLSQIEKFCSEGALGVARSVFRCITSTLSEVEDDVDFETVWLKYSEFEKFHGSPKTQEAVLRDAIYMKNFTKSDNLWLQLYELCKQDEPDEARKILREASKATGTERVIIAAADFERNFSGSEEGARQILADACDVAKTPSLVMEAANLERQAGHLDEAIKLLKDGLDRFKTHADFYLTLGQIEEQRGRNDSAKDYYAKGLKFLPHCTDLWISLAKCEERANHIPKARSKLEMARQKNPKNALLWLEAARLEVRAFESKKMQSSTVTKPAAALTLLAKGIRECRGQPNVDLLEKEETLLAGKSRK